MIAGGPRRASAAAVLAAASLLAGGCDRAEPERQRVPQSATAVAAAPPVRVTVGPVPGLSRQTREPANPLAADPQASQQGRVLFEAFNCAGCHGGHGGGGMGPSLRDDLWVYGDSDAQIFDSIAVGRAYGMPAWGTMLPRQEIWKLVTYIQSMRTPQEPDPPT